MANIQLSENRSLTQLNAPRVNFIAALTFIVPVGLGALATLVTLNPISAIVGVLLHRVREAVPEGRVWMLSAIMVAGAAGAVLNTYYDPRRAYQDPDDPSTRPVGIDHIFDVTVLPSYRLTIDMSDLDGARKLNPLSTRADILAGAIASRVNDLPRMRLAFSRALARDPDPDPPLDRQLDRA